MDTQKKVNPGIQCSVMNCAYHAPEDSCSLSQIKVGCSCSHAPAESDGTECCSFKPGQEIR